jgi:hypothetical protein
VVKIRNFLKSIENYLLEIEFQIHVETIGDKSIDCSFCLRQCSIEDLDINGFDTFIEYFESLMWDYILVGIDKFQIKKYWYKYGIKE